MSKPDNCIKVIRHSALSMCYRILRVLLIPLDLIPVLLTLYLAVWLCLMLATIVSPEAYEMLSFFGVPNGIVPESFYADLRAANIQALPIAISLIPFLVLVGMRNRLATPPRSVATLVWMTLYISAGAWLLKYHAAREKARFVESGALVAQIPPRPLADPVITSLGIEGQYAEVLGRSLDFLGVAIVFDAVAYFVLLFVFVLAWLLGWLRITTLFTVNPKGLASRLRFYSKELFRSINKKSLIRFSCLILLYSVAMQADRFTAALPVSETLLPVSLEIRGATAADDTEFFNILVGMNGFVLMACVIILPIFRCVTGSWRIGRVIVTVLLVLSLYALSIRYSVEQSPVLGYVTTGLCLYFLLVAPYFFCVRYLATQFAKCSIRVWYAACHAYPASAKKSLLLRPFMLDHTTLRHTRTQLEMLLPISTRARSLEEIIARSIRNKATLVAAGKPGEVTQPIGALRSYISNDHWKSFVTDTILAADRIVFIMGASNYTIWEAHQLIATDAIDKLVLVTHPDVVISTGYVDQNRELIEHFGDFSEIRSLVCSGTVRSIFRRANCTYIVKNRRSKEHDYQLALDYAFS